MPTIDLDYEPDSLLPPINRDTVQECEKFLSRHFERPIKFPEAYVEHVLQFHGGVPGVRCFTTPSGERRALCRFMNFIRREDLSPPMLPTWRESPPHDIRLDYSHYTMNDCDPWCGRLYESGGMLVPIAAIDTAGHDARVMMEFDLLCFDFQHGPEPPVFTWCFETSWSRPQDTKRVADSFAEFLTMLHRCPTDDPLAGESIGPEYF